MAHLQPILRKATERGKITQNNDHYAVQGYLRLPILVQLSK